MSAAPSFKGGPEKFSKGFTRGVLQKNKKLGGGLKFKREGLKFKGGHKKISLYFSD